MFSNFFLGFPYRPGPGYKWSVSPKNEETGEIAVELAKPKLSDPPKFAVLLMNDDYTTMEFVVEVLKKYFRKTEEEALQIMLHVHQQGKGVAGLYSREIAETKVVQVEEYARTKGFPLHCAVEPQG